METIDNAIEYGEIAIDKLSLAVKRADFLNGHLEQQLVNIEQDLKQLGPQPGSGESKPYESSPKRTLQQKLKQQGNPEYQCEAFTVTMPYDEMAW